MQPFSNPKRVVEQLHLKDHTGRVGPTPRFNMLQPLLFHMSSLSRLGFNCVSSASTASGCHDRIHRKTVPQVINMHTDYPFPTNDGSGQGTFQEDLPVEFHDG